MAGVNQPIGVDTDPGPCDISELLSAYLDGELRSGELDRVVAHLSSCLDCIAEFHELKEVRAAVRMLPRLEVPDRLLPESHHGPALSAYLDGELPTTEHQDLQTHLAECSECRAELHELDAARTAVRSLPRLEPPEFIEFHRGRAMSPPRRSMKRWQAATIAASAVAAVAIGATALRSPAPESTVDIDMLADRHMARASVEAGFTVVPAAGTFGGAP